jgi:predicted MFS family arabinose efflux permease
MANKNYRNLLIGDGLSAFGSWIDFLAILTMAAYFYKVNSFEMAAVSAAALLPGILLSKRIGQAVDGSNPKTLLQLSIGGRLLMTAAIVFSTSLYLFLVFVAIRSIFTSVAPPAINVLAVRTIEQDERPRFYSALNVINNSAKVIAPAIGTVASSLSSEVFALLLSGLCSLLAMLFFGRLAVQPTTARSMPNQAKSSLIDQPNFLPFVYVAASYAFFVFMVNNLVPLALQQSGFDKALLGILISCSGAGNILTGIWLAKRRKEATITPQLISVALPASLQAIGFGCIGVVLAFTPNLHQVLLPICFVIIGTFSARFAIQCNVYMSTHFASNIGAVSAAVQGYQNAMILIAPMIGAFVLENAGSSNLFMFAAALGLASFGLLILKLKVSNRTAPQP